MIIYLLHFLQGLEMRYDNFFVKKIELMHLMKFGHVLKMPGLGRKLRIPKANNS